jgi:hypothetical protein
VWRWLVVVTVFSLAWSRWALAADGEVSLDLATLSAVATAIGTVIAGVAGAAWRFWPRGAPPSPPPTESATLPPQAVPAQERVPTKSVLIRQIKSDEALQRFGELLPKLERVDWDALDDLGVRLDRDREHVDRRFDKIEGALDTDRGTD